MKIKAGVGMFLVNKAFKHVLGHRVIYSIVLLNIMFLAWLIFMYIAGQPYASGGPDISSIITYLLRISQGEIPYKDFQAVYGPLFLYFTFGIYMLFGGAMHSFYIIFWVLYPFLGFMFFSIFAYYFFRNKTYAAYLLWLIFLFNSIFVDGTNGNILRIYPVFFGLLFLVRFAPVVKNWEFLYGILFGLSCLFDIVGGIILGIITVLYLVLSAFSESFKIIIQRIAKVFLGFTITSIAVLLFLIHNGVLSETLLFYSNLLDKTPAYLIKTPSFGELKNISVLFSEKYFFLLVLCGYLASIIYIFFHLLKTRKINQRFITSILLCVVGMIYYRRIIDEYLRAPGVFVIPLLTLILLNFENMQESCSNKRKVKIAEVIVIGILSLAALMTSFSIKYTKLLFVRYRIVTRVNKGFYFEKAKMRFAEKEEIEDYTKVLDYIKKNVGENEYFYTYPWGLYHYFSGRRVPVRVNSDFLCFNHAKMYEAKMIQDLKRNNVRYIIINFNNALPSTFADSVNWREKNITPVIFHSDLELFILENYEPCKLFPRAMMLKKAERKSSYPQPELIEVITADKLRIKGAAVISDSKVGILLKNISKTLTLDFKPEMPFKRRCSALYLKTKFLYEAPLSNLWNQEKFFVDIHIFDERGEKHDFKNMLFYSSSLDGGYLKIPFTNSPVMISKFSIVFHFDLSLLNGPPSKIYLDWIEAVLHQDKGYSYLAVEK